MRAAVASVVFVALAAASPNPVPQAVTSAIAPNQSPPAGCSENYDGSFEITPVNISSSKRDLDNFEFDKRNTMLGITLKNGILMDPQGRTGYVASNQQFQFDKPPQAGAIWTAGFSVCSNGHLALGNDQTWHRCLSGSFYNLYFHSIGGQCIPSYFIARPVAAGDGPAPPSQNPSISIVSSVSSASASASASNSMNGTAGMGNATMSGSSASMSMSGFASGMSSSAMTTGGAGGGTRTNGGGMTNTMGGGATNTMGGGMGTAASSSSAAPSSAAAPMATMKAEMFGLAAGVMALAAL